MERAEEMIQDVLKATQAMERTKERTKAREQALGECRGKQSFAMTSLNFISTESVDIGEF